jgi:hypothetical protein
MIKIKTYRYYVAFLNWRKFSTEEELLPFCDFLGITLEQELEMLKHTPRDSGYFLVTEDIYRKVNILLGPHGKTIVKAYHAKNGNDSCQ